MPAPVVLSVEDEPLIAEFVQASLEDAGYTVISAANADEAIAILQNRSDIRLIITDIDMPGSMDGLKLAAAVRNRWPPIKIIITSGKHRPDANALPESSLFLPKPYSIDSVVEAVRSFD